jgi:hypothetical protein
MSNVNQIEKKSQAKVDKKKLNEVAKDTAQHVNSEYMHVHRGVYSLGIDIHVVYGNDGYSIDKRSRSEAQAVKDHAKRIGCPASDIQVEPNGFTWAVAVRGDSCIVAALNSVAWLEWTRRSVRKKQGINRLSIS